ncbi:uncharacterized protein EV422DRAFT_517281 [Fimicolochytrium jonesii]|uniref:uncharacterized protein n=1 Tax=Fimicolochytrium jonesii TaxID=1396493 RepID=UPI0022FF354E|nr:uncharacterized protein EV422DRAFT_517281 [Fimicolochytrium jonesii]KAI8825059.1 hypothetical protein EV422DRAFT_517281 [Fimicolochytrium jonesii]
MRPSTAFLAALAAGVPALITGAPSANLPWTFCDSSKDYDVKVSSVQAVYEPDTKVLNVWAAATSAAAIGSKLGNGTVTSIMRVVGFDEWQVEADACTSVPCPVTAGGSFVLFKNITIPANIPFIDFKPRVALSDASATPKELMCIQINLTLESTALTYVLVWASVFTALAAGFTTLLARWLRPEFRPTLFDMSSGWAPHTHFLPARMGPGFIDVALFAQFIAATAQLNFEYPAPYQDAIRILAWATGTWNVPGIRDLANAIRGDRPDDVDTVTRTGTVVAHIFGRQAAGATVDGIPAEVGSIGYERYAEVVGLKPGLMFLNTLIPFILVVILVSGWCLFLHVVRRMKPDHHLFSRPGAEPDRTQYYWRGWLLRVYVFFYFGLTSTALHQLTLKGEPLSIMIIAGIVFMVLGIALPIILTFRLVHASKTDPSSDSLDLEHSGTSMVNLIDDDDYYTPGRRSTATTDGGRVHRTGTSSTVITNMTGRHGRGESFSSKTSRVSRATTRTHKDTSKPLPSLYSDRKFMLIYGPFINHFKPKRFMSHAALLVPLTWWLRLAPAIAVGVLGKIVPPWLQFVAFMSGEGLLFLWITVMKPYAGKLTNLWHWFLSMCRCGFVIFLWAAFLFRRYWGIEWITQLIAVALILSTVGMHLLFLGVSGLKFMRSGWHIFRRDSTPIPLATDPIDVRRDTLPRSRSGTTTTTASRAPTMVSAVSAAKAKARRDTLASQARTERSMTSASGRLAATPGVLSRYATASRAASQVSDEDFEDEADVSDAYRQREHEEDAQTPLPAAPAAAFPHARRTTLVDEERARPSTLERAVLGTSATQGAAGSSSHAHRVSSPVPAVQEVGNPYHDA